MRTRVPCVLVTLLVAALAAASPSAAAPTGQSSQLHQYAQRTWASLAAMADPHTGLPADVLEADGTRSVQTSSTDIGAYLWSAVAAWRTGIIGRGELDARPSRTLTTLEGMERYGDT